MIQFRNISKTYERPDRAQLEVLKDVDGSIEKGAFAAVVGPSGSEGHIGQVFLMHLLDHMLDFCHAHQLLGRSAMHQHVYNRQFGIELFTKLPSQI